MFIRNLKFSGKYVVASFANHLLLCLRSCLYTNTAKMSDSSDDSSEKSISSTEENEKKEESGANVLFVIVAMISFFKMLLIPAYHSTDFEVHRNWLSITHSLPLHKWYVEATSIWTLDYPPFFAYFQLLLSYPATFFDDKMLIISNLNYKSIATIVYMRLTVILSDLVLVYGTKECCDFLSFSSVRKSSKWADRWYSPVATLQFLLLCNVGLIIVDNIHFQYNGVLFGVLLLSIASILKGQHLRAAFYFAVLLNMKHIFLYMAPAYFVYLLRNVCFSNQTPGLIIPSGSFIFSKFIQIGTIVGFVFGISLGPFINLGQTNQLISRLFPFKRGLFHSYWAPNIWSLYSTLDKVLEVFFRSIGYDVPRTTITAGLTDEASYSILPNVTPFITFLLTAVFAAPCLFKLWKFPGNPLHFIRCLVLCALTSFIFGWHVHEKAILMAIIPLSVLAVIWQHEGKFFFLLSVTGYYSLLPLLPPGLETPLKFSLLLLHVVFLFTHLANLYNENIKSLIKLPFLNKYESLYILALLPMSFVVSYIPYILPQLVFLPLLLTSAYCSVGILYCWASYYYYFMNKREFDLKRKIH